MTRRSAQSCTLGVLLLLAPPLASLARATANRPNKPAIATIQVGSSDMLVSITGRGFGSPGPLASLRFTITPVTGSTTVVTLASTDPAVLLWHDGQIVAKLPATNVRRAVAAVLAPNVQPSNLKAVRYGYETFDTSATAGTARVNGLAMDPDLHHTANAHRVFLNFEAHNTLAWWVPQAAPATDPPSGSVQPLPGYPVPAVPIFRSPTFDPDGPGPMGKKQVATTGSCGGDNAFVDTQGLAWFNEYGCFADASVPGSQDLANHSRLLAFEAAANQFRLYNIPGDQQVAYAMARDPIRPRMWVALFGGGRPNRLLVFNPDSASIPHDDFGFTWTTDKTCVANQCTCVANPCTPLGFSKSCQTDGDCILAEQMCPPGTSVDGATDCYLEIPLPDSLQKPASQIIRMLVYPSDGSLWMTNFFVGAELVRLDPASKTYLHVPLPRSPGAADPSVGAFPPFPIELRLTKTGDLVFQTQFGNTFGVIPRSDLLSPTRLAACTTLKSKVAAADCGIFDLNPTPPPALRSPDVSCVNPCITETVLGDGFLPCTPASRDDAACPWDTGGQNGNLYYGWITRDKHVWFDIAGRGVGYIKLSDLQQGRSRFVLLPPSSLYPSGPFSCGPGLGNVGAIAVDESNDSVWYGEYCRRRIARYFPLD